MVTANGCEAFELITVRLRHDHDVVLARQRTRVIAGLVGFDTQDQVKFATAVSEIARNACRYANGGEVKFSVMSTNGNDHMPDEDAGVPAIAGLPKLWWLVVRITDKGGGIPDLDAVLDGTYVSSTGMGLGIVGARRLSDWFKLDSQAGTGTSIDLARRLPRNRQTFSAKDAEAISAHLSSVVPSSPLEELERQNQEILGAMEEIREKQLAVERLNAELAETNRGVLALYAELDDRAAELKRISEYKSRFLSDISHELRTPLTSVQNVSRILLDRSDGDLTPEQQRQVTMIRKAAEGLTEMVNELLDLARIEAGRTTVHAAAFNIVDLFSALRGLIRPIVPGDAVTLVIDDHAAEQMPQMNTDERRLGQILRNFLSNAIKFTEHGTVTLSVSREPNDMIRFTVSDTGIGIAPEDMARIFDDFTQVDSPIQRRVRGSGLGLPLTKKLAALLGGSVYAESTPGVGSVFTLEIPRVYGDGTTAIANDDES